MVGRPRLSLPKRLLKHKSSGASTESGDDTAATSPFQAAALPGQDPLGRVKVQVYAGRDLLAVRRRVTRPLHFVMHRETDNCFGRRGARRMVSSIHSETARAPVIPSSESLWAVKAESRVTALRKRSILFGATSRPASKPSLKPRSRKNLFYLSLRPTKTPSHSKLSKCAILIRRCLS